MFCGVGALDGWQGVCASMCACVCAFAFVCVLVCECLSVVGGGLQSKSQGFEWESVPVLLGVKGMVLCTLAGCLG